MDNKEQRLGTRSLDLMESPGFSPSANKLIDSTLFAGEVPCSMMNMIVPMPSEEIFTYVAAIVHFSENGSTWTVSDSLSRSQPSDFQDLPESDESAQVIKAIENC
ncbi:hypothetical protein [Actinoplanes auranticolor]|uniref:Uncharacterized protein n=1 Tax=Actinoplanes auranticolor TaxID=47988 RepID=A0A919SEP9_9ACTN|nr:hypothetical protein [Actinoplanes auranticolor]GIM71047.1 hypothetical protein Aau02nite_43910 [Actinoplanes auranticolor]